MIEIRLCNHAAAQWFTSNARTSGGITPPSDLATRFGLRAYEKGHPLSEADFREKILASAGTCFESADLVASVAHALAVAAPTRETPRQPEAYAVETFVDGGDRYGDVPQILRDAGVYSCMGETEAHKIAMWMEQISPQEFAAEVREMYGEDRVELYRSVARSLERIFKSVDIHNADLCCLRR